MEDTKKNLFLHTGAVLAALGASLCCILPVAVAVLGVGSAALGARLEPFRPWLAAVTLAFLGYSFYRAYRPTECAEGEACAIPASRRRHRVALWIISAVALVLMAFPYYSSWLF